MMETFQKFITDDCEQGKRGKIHMSKRKRTKASAPPPFSPTLGQPALPGILESGSWTRMSDHFSSGRSQEGRCRSNSHSLFRRKQAAPTDRQGRQADSRQSLTEFLPPRVSQRAAEHRLAARHPFRDVFLYDYTVIISSSYRILWQI